MKILFKINQDKIKMHEYHLKTYGYLIKKYIILLFNKEVLDRNFT